MIIGIDLGTTNSAAAIWRDGQAVLVPNAIGDLLTPSAVSLDDKGAILIGMAARERQSTHPRDTVSAFKRYIGTQQTVTLGKRTYDAEELSALVLRQLKADAEAFAGESVTGAVITVPAYFNDRQRKATRRAGELAGLKVERLVNEPTAAALAFGIQTREQEPFLVFDLGGGTFDVSIVEVFEGVVEVRASSGDNRLGGEDFNDKVIEVARRMLDPARKLDGADQVVLHELLRAAAERTRRKLTEADEAEFAIVWNGESFTANLTAAVFEEAAAPLLQRLRDPVLRSLRDSNIRVETLSEIVLVGGSTRMPVVRRAITRMFGRFPNATVHPDHAVALGAAVQAGLLARAEALEEVRLTDVSPFTLGVDNAEPDGAGGWRTGLFSPIIDRNTTIPASRVRYYGTVADNQRAIRFGIYQGEAREVAGNVKLGEVTLSIPPKPAGEVMVECRFTYDSSGILEVDVSIPATGITRNLVIIDEADAMDDKQIAARRAELAALKVHPREESENAAVLARASRCYEGFIGERRDLIGQWIGAFEASLGGQDPRLIREARALLVEQLDSIEGERFL
ncbi:molecular chaperone HscC [Sphingomonas sp. HITSZ_GF]|uniref:Hsp70 family protein n=1 Tax=Sphingomonas sp. HITSZ_GF TaxID=3037247 RepID=UPI00240E22E3|nr:molecular chaperone HscC [Sphingomonas sp. HITSZ_GF]MDG2533943.1 molecular chaperone HscC [Sphingomonas sp. HITSZ_GF]